MCRSGCPTQDHDTYGECCRASGIRVAYCATAKGWDFSKQKRWDRELEGYRDAVAEGLNPEGTSWSDIDAARRKADEGQ